MKKINAEKEFYRKFNESSTHDEIVSYIETEITPYCKISPITLFDNFSKFHSGGYTKILNFKTNEYWCSFTPSKYTTDSFGAKFKFFVVEDISTKNIVDSYFELEIFGYNYRKMSNVLNINFISKITNSDLDKVFNLSRLSIDKKLEYYIKNIDIEILKKIADKYISKFTDIDDTDDIKELLEFYLHEDEMISVPLRRAITYQAKKLNILL